MFLLLITIRANSQTQFRITSIDSTKGNTVYCTGRDMKTATLVNFPIRFRGMGRKKIEAGMGVTYYPHGLRRKRHIHYVLNN